MLRCPAQVFEWSEGAPAPDLLFSCCVANTSPALAAQRALFLRASACLDPDEDISGTCMLHLEAR